MPEMLACLTNAGAGGKTRFSCKTDSIVEAIPLSLGRIQSPNRHPCKYEKTPMKQPSEARALRPLPSLIFASRWLQLPLYLGLIVAQAIYVWLFWQELYYLLMATFGDA